MVFPDKMIPYYWWPILLLKFMSTIWHHTNFMVWGRWRSTTSSSNLVLRLRVGVYMGCRRSQWQIRIIGMMLMITMHSMPKPVLRISAIDHSTLCSRRQKCRIDRAVVTASVRGWASSMRTRKPEIIVVLQYP